MSSCGQVRTASCCYTLNRAAVLRSSNQRRSCQRSPRLLVLFCTHQRSMCLLALCLPQLEGPRGSFSSLSSLRGQRSHFSHLSLMKESLQHLESADGSDSTQPPPVFPPVVSTLLPAVPRPAPSRAASTLSVGLPRPAAGSLPSGSTAATSSLCLAWSGLYLAWSCGCYTAV